MDKERLDSNHEDAGADGSSKLTDVLRKVMSVGLGAAFMTEESVRGALGGLNVPKDVLNTVLSQANRGKEEMLNRIGNETIKLISRIDFVKEASRFVEEHKFRISAEIDIVKKQTGESGLQIKSDVRIKD